MADSTQRTPTHVVMLRHGRTEMNAQGRLSGHVDHAIDERGAAEAIAAAAAISRHDELSTGGEVTVVSSPLQRCVQTAEYVTEAFAGVDMPVHIDDRFVELNYGEWDGRPLGDVPLETWREWQTNPEFAPPGGETLGDVTLRVGEALADWAARTEGPLIVVSHVSPIKAGVVWALGVGDDITWRMRLDNASITRLTVAGTRGTLLSFNETAHLPE